MRWTIGHKIASIAPIPTVALIVVSFFYLKPLFEERRIAKEMENNINLLIKTSRIMTALQEERGLSSTFLSGGNVLDQMKGARKGTDGQMTNLDAIVRSAGISEQHKNLLLNLPKEIELLRDKVEQRRDAQEVFQSYTELIKKLSSVEQEIVNRKTTKGIGKVMASLILLDEAKESIGRVRGMGSSIISKGTTPQSDQLKLCLESWESFLANITSPALTLSLSDVAKLQELQRSQEFEKASKFSLAIISGSFKEINPQNFFYLHQNHRTS